VGILHGMMTLIIFDWRWRTRALFRLSYCFLRLPLPHIFWPTFFFRRRLLKHNPLIVLLRVSCNSWIVFGLHKIRSTKHTKHHGGSGTARASVSFDAEPFRPFLWNASCYGKDKAADPTHISAFGAEAKMARPGNISDLVEKLGSSHRADVSY
jgi:hypothetical protein